MPPAVPSTVSPLAVGNSIRIIRGIAQNDGLLHGFYRGLTPNVVGNSVSWALYFVLYDRLKSGIHAYEGLNTSLSYYDYFLASGTAGERYPPPALLYHIDSLGALTALCSNPIWVIKTRMLSTSAKHPGAYVSIVDGIKQIYHFEGISGFYRGLVPSLFGVTHGAIQFMAYEQLKIYRSTNLSGGQKDLSTRDFLILSGLAKFIAGSATYPYQVVRARLQMYNADTRYKGASDVISQVWKKEGVRGFYKGLGPNLLRVLPSTWVTFLVYEKTKLYLPTLIEKEHGL